MRCMIRPHKINSLSLILSNLINESRVRTTILLFIFSTYLVGPFFAGPFLTSASLTPAITRPFSKNGNEPIRTGGKRVSLFRNQKKTFKIHNNGHRAKIKHLFHIPWQRRWLTCVLATYFKCSNAKLKLSHGFSLGVKQKNCNIIFLRIMEFLTIQN